MRVAAPWDTSALPQPCQSLHVGPHMKGCNILLKLLLHGRGGGLQEGGRGVTHGGRGGRVIFARGGNHGWGEVFRNGFLTVWWW